MKSNLQEKIKQLNDESKYYEVISLFEELPEEERDWKTIGAYVRALNNMRKLERAVEVSLQYVDQGKDDALWHYRLGYAYVNLGRNDEAKSVLLRGKELAKNNTELLEWFDELLEQMKDNESRAEAEARRRAAYKPRDPSVPPFECMDFSDFWNDSDEKYFGAPATDEMFNETEKALGYKLPKSYKLLMKQHNGGYPNRRLFRLADVGIDEDAEIRIYGISGVDPANEWSINGEFGSKFWMEEWGYPDIGIAICDTPSAGHEMIFLDYRACGKDGEPEVVRIDQESDYAITYLAGDFESFICELLVG
ncbi:MAG: SMI1/KNR4 family protein [Clostridiales Family XIII bacterium]|jgi:tetratricopeptide (TPR) repeat protein|nr:SMI1/KNR4 family protein [Clostridiales Family XIII bacterium]